MEEVTPPKEVRVLFSEETGSDIGQKKNQHMSTTNPASGVSVSPSVQWRQASQLVLVVKNLPTHARDVKDVGLIPGSIRSPRGPAW